MRGSGWKRDSRPFSTQIKNFSLSRRAIFCQFEFKLSAGEGRGLGRSQLKSKKFVLIFPIFEKLNRTRQKVNKLSFIF